QQLHELSLVVRAKQRRRFVTHVAPKTESDWTRLETWQFRMAGRAGVHMLAALLAAAMQRREHLARIEAQLRIKNFLDPMLYQKISRAELVRHQVALLNA